MNGTKGVILITTLWIMAILSLLAVGIGFRVSLEVRLSKYAMDKLEARYLAKMGIESAKERLMNDAGRKDYDSLYECGIFLDTTINETPESIFGFKSNKFGHGAFRIGYEGAGSWEPGVGSEGQGAEDQGIVYGVMDEERKVNINMEKIVVGDKRTEYRRILTVLSPNLTDEMISAMIDWQDSDDDVTYPGGAEKFDYESEHGTIPADAPFSFVDELRLVKGLTPEIFDEIKDDITVYGDGKININTASEKVLYAIIDDGKGTYKAFIDNIIDFRDGDDKLKATSDDRVFTAIEQLSAIAKDNFEKNRVSQLGPWFIFKSANLRIRSSGKVGALTKTITCVVKSDTGAMKTEYYHEE